MKKIIIVLSLFLLAASYSAQAQYSYKPFRLDIGMGLSFPNIGAGIGAGVLFAIEPKYAVIPKVSVGMRMELNTLFSFQSYPNSYYGYYSEYEYFEMKMSRSLLATCDYHFTTGTFRPFVGLGVGIYLLDGYTEAPDNYYDDDYYYYDDGSYEIPSKVNFGGMIRAGFDVTHFRFALEYNYAGLNKNSRYSYGEMDYSYFAITVGGYIGGKKVKNKNK